MPDNNIELKITANTSGVVSGVNAADKSLAELEGNFVSTQRKAEILKTAADNAGSAIGNMPLGRATAALQGVQQQLGTATNRAETFAQTLNGIGTGRLTEIEQKVAATAPVFNSAVGGAAHAFLTIDRALSSVIGSIGRYIQGLKETQPPEALDKTDSNIKAVGNAFREAAKDGETFKLTNKLLGQASKETSDELDEETQETKKFSFETNHAATSTHSLHDALQKLSNATSGIFSKLTRGVKIFGEALLGITSTRQFTQQMITSASDYIEAQNLLEVTTGKSYGAASDNIKILEEYGGIAATSLMQATGALDGFLREMGLAEKKAVDMGNALSNVAVDLASLYNTDYASVMENLESGLQGMTRAVRKYGMDLSEASIAQTAHELGIEKSVATMSQAEKVQLRYINVIRQSQLAQTDYARTIQSPANMLRILKDQVVETARAIGNVFQPVLSKILPVLIKFAFVIQAVTNAFAALFGSKIKMPEVSVGGYEAAADAIDDVAAGTSKAAKKQKELNQLIGGFDEIHQQQAPSEPSSGGGGGGVSGGGGGGGLDLDLPSYDSLLKTSDFLPKLREEAEKTAQALISWVQPIIASFKLLKEPVETFIGYAQPAFETFMSSVGKGLQTFLIGGLVPGLKNLMQTLGPHLEDIAGLFGTLFETVGGALAKLMPTVGTLLGETLGSIGSALNGVFTKISPLIINLAGAISKTLGPVIEALLPIVSSVITSVGGLIEKVLPVITNLVKTIGPIITALIEKIGPPLTKLIDAILDSVGEIISSLLPPLLDLLVELIDPLMDIVGSIADDLVTLLAELLKSLTPLLTGVLVPLLQVIMQLLSPLLRIISAILKPIISLLTALLVPILDVLIGALDLILSGFTRIISIALRLISIALEPIIKTIETLSGVITSAAKRFVKFFTDVWNRAKAFIQVFKNNLKATYTWLTQLFFNIKTFLSTKIVAPIKNIFEKMFDGIEKLLKGAINGAIGGLNKAIGAINSFLNGVIGALNWVIGKLNKLPGVNIPGVSVGAWNIDTIPKLAKGGVVSGPTQAVIGEGRYSEAIVPLDNSPQMQELISQIASAVNSSNNGTQTIKVYIGNEQLDTYIYNANRKLAFQTNGGY